MFDMLIVALIFVNCAKILLMMELSKMCNQCVCVCTCFLLSCFIPRHSICYSIQWKREKNTKDT